MPSVLKEWKVLPHRELTSLDTGIATVVGEVHMPLTQFERRMTVVKLAGGGLVIYNAIALHEPQMAELERMGRPQFMIVPGDHHRMDAGIWKARYPQLRVVTVNGARKGVEEVVAVNTTHPDFNDAQVAFLAVPGTDEREAALVVHRPSGTTLILNDLIGNMHDRSGFSGWVLRLLGFAGDEPQVSRPAKSKLIDNKSALQKQFRAWAADSQLKRIVVSHGDPIEADPAGTLNRLADSLS